MISEHGLPAVQIPVNTIPLPSASSLLLLNAFSCFNLGTPLGQLMHKLITKVSVILAQDGLPGFCLFTEGEIVTVEVVEHELIEMAIKRVESILVIEKLQKQRVEQGVKEVEGSCAVCLEELLMEDEDEAKKLIIAMTCSHLFHESCIFRWLEERNSCPMCRRAAELEPADFNSFVALLD